jgi:hypothetical protein
LAIPRATLDATDETGLPCGPVPTGEHATNCALRPEYYIGNTAVRAQWLPAVDCASRSWCVAVASVVPLVATYAVLRQHDVSLWPTVVLVSTMSVASRLIGVSAVYVWTRARYGW